MIPAAWWYLLACMSALFIVLELHVKWKERRRLRQQLYADELNAKSINRLNAEDSIGM